MEEVDWGRIRVDAIKSEKAMDREVEQCAGRRHDEV
jgi:hypothetical protein